MSAIGSTDYTRRGMPRTAAGLSLIAAGLFVSSAVLQFMASLQRWIAFRLSVGEYVAEDHLYDYIVPAGPWVPIGNSAQLFGSGILILALGVVVMTLSVIARPRRMTRGFAVVIRVAEFLLAILIAGSFILYGLHPFLSGLSGTPSPLLEFGGTGWIAIVGLIVLIVLWAFTSPAAMMACVFVMGATGLGYFAAAFHVAPLLAGYVSHDTTPWTETVIAIWTGVAGAAMILAAVEVSRRTATRVAPHGTERHPA